MQQFLNVLVSGVHDAPAEKGTRTVHTDAFIHVANLTTSLVVNVHKSRGNADATSAHRALHRYFYHIQRIEHRTNERTYTSTGQKLLYRLRHLVFLCKNRALSNLRIQ